MSHAIARVKVEVTADMVEAMRDAGLDCFTLYGLTDAMIAQAYKAARAIEPGEHQGVMQIGGSQ